MMKLFSRGSRDRPRADWRGWVALAWVVFWGISYCNLAVRARGQRVLDWFKPHPTAVSRAVDPSLP
jgi:hypothetical protein